MTAHQLLRAIRAYCSRSGITESRVGRAAVNDPALVIRLRRGVQPGANTVSRVLAYIGGEA